MGAVVAVFIGEYDISHKATLRLELATLREEPHLILDMSAVSYIDSTAVTELIAFQNGRGKLGLPRAGVVVRAPPVRRLFQMLQLETILRVATAIDEVLPKDGASINIRWMTPGDEAASSLLRVV
jgi:anti-anti-sigma factor